MMVTDLSREVTTEERAALRAHLRSCPECTTEAEALARTWGALGSLPEAEVPAGIWERVQAKLPAPAERLAARRPWPAAVVTAGLGILISIAASWALPYERAVSVCSEALRSFPLFAALPDPAVTFVVGILYGLLPLGLAAVVVGCRLSGAGGHPGMGAAVLFGAVAVPYVLIACAGLPASFTAVLTAGILAGALTGGPAGTWAGGKLLAPART
jgi:hypothetical protein